MADDPKIWMPVFIGDLLADTMHLTPSEFGAYMRIMFHQWRRGHMAEDDIPTITGMSVDAWSIAQAKLKQFLSIDEAGLLFQRRTDREKEKATHNRSVFTKRATDAANKRWSRHREEKAKVNASSIAQALHEQSLSDAHHHHLITPSLRSGGASGAAAPPAKKKRNGEDTANKADNGSGGRGDAADSQKVALDAARRRNNVALGSVSSTQHSAVESDRYEWLKAEVVQFMAAVGGLKVDDVPWSDRDEAGARAMLRACPGLTQAQVGLCLEHRASSVHLGYLSGSLQPSKWLRDLPSFLSGPLTKFHEPIPKVAGKWKRSG